MPLVSTKEKCHVLTPKNSLPTTLQTNKQSKNNENSVPTTFKALMRETSVYKYYVELKKDILTEQGFLDLAKVPGLYIAGAGQFLKKLRLDNHLRLKDIAKIVNVQENHVWRWENNYRNIPLQSLVKLAEASGKSRDTIYSLIDQGKFSLKTNIPVRLKKICPIVHYFTPRNVQSSRVTVHPCSVETLSKIKETLNVKSKYYSKNRQRVINSKALNNYLRSFFRYTKVPKIHLPLTREVKDWYDDGIDLKRAVIIPCLQSDGSMNSNKRKRIIFIGNNKSIHDYFVDAMYYEYGLLPSTYFSINYETIYQKRPINEIVDEVMNLAGNSKTQPAHRQTVKEYLQEPQPHLNYLINASETEQKIALRIWASTEGWVSIGDNYKEISPYLGIGCAHPILIKQLQHIAQRHNIHFIKSRNKERWSGFCGLENKALSGFIKFLKFGGFIKGVKISKKSKYHEGIVKDVLMLGILEYLRQRKTTNKWTKNLPRAFHHYNINQIIKNREYKSADYYLNYFS